VSPLQISTVQGAAVITIAREERRNALSRATLKAFGQLKQPLLNDRTLRAIVITGAGDKAFCAGADLKERINMNDAEVRELLSAYEAELGWLDTSPLPVVAAINGVALGGGLELALLCDLRIASPTAVLGLPETGLGIIPGAGGTQRLTRLIGPARAKELILLGQSISAEAALATGLIHRVGNTETPLLDQALSWIKPILEGAPVAQAAALEAIDRAMDVPLKEGLVVERQAYERCLGTEDRNEALRAFSEKRKPRFVGR
jgi:methylglutaconyl-CoA hydratase